MLYCTHKKIIDKYGQNIAIHICYLIPICSEHLSQVISRITSSGRCATAPRVTLAPNLLPCTDIWYNILVQVCCQHLYPLLWSLLRITGLLVLHPELPVFLGQFFLESDPILTHILTSEVSRVVLYCLPTSTSGGFLESELVLTDFVD